MAKKITANVRKPKKSYKASKTASTVRYMSAKDFYKIVDQSLEEIKPVLKQLASE